MRNNPSPMPPGPGGNSVSVPGRSIVSAQRHSFPSGRIVELRETTTTSVSPDGAYVTEHAVEIEPSLDDGSMPDRISDIAECANPECLRLVCASRNSESCPKCGHIFCKPCMTTTEVEGQTMRICRICADSLTLPAFKKIFRVIRKGLWG